MTEGERETLAIALDHAWRWYENRRVRQIQLIQILILWLAILGTAYGVSLQAKLYGIGGFLGLVTAISVIATSVEARRLNNSAALAEKAVAELEQRIAEELNIDALRLVLLEQHRPAQRMLGLDLQQWVVSISLLIALAGSFYTWMGMS